MPPKKRQGKPKASAPAASSAKAPRRSKLAKEHNISAAEESEIREAFSLFAEPHEDYESSAEGAMPIAAIRKCLTALGVPPTSAAELRELTETVDPDESGYVPYEHFVAIAALKMDARSDEQAKEEVEQAFRLFTRGGEKITLATLKRVAKELKENIDDQVLKDMILEANGGAGLGRGVDAEEFEDVMKRAGVFR